MSRSHEKEGKTIRTVKDTLEHAILYLRTVVKWCAAAALIGLVGGAVGALFHLGVEYATMLREEVPALLWALPLAGAAIVALYQLLRTQGIGTNAVLDAVHNGRELPILLIPAIFLATLLTHLAGGSAGREGAALQIGGAAGALLGLPAPFAAALGVTGLFCGMTNCPITSLLISVELFGADGLLCYAVVCAVSYVFSGYRGLYSSQTILYSKLRAEFINVHTK